MKKLLICLLFICFNVNALTITTINAEWLWDDKEPHEGQVVGYDEGDIRPPTEKQYQTKVDLIAKAIKKIDADIVALVEIEGKHVAEDIAALLPDWNVAYQDGRDTFTEQDVAILTKFEILNGTVSNLPDFFGTSSVTNKKVTPSKVLGVGLKEGDKTYYVVAAHLSSKRNNSKEKDAKRAAQAEAIRKAVVSQYPNYDHFVVLGDMNDLPESKPLKFLLGKFDDEKNLVQVATKENYSYVYKGKKQLIDHILVDSGLADAKFENEDLPQNISDHRVSTLITN